MPKPLQQEVVTCAFFTWRFGQRDNGVFYADGRSETPNLGRHSLGTRDRNEAISSLRQLDIKLAVQHGKADPSVLKDVPADRITLADGVARYLKYVERPAILGGATKATAKRYRAVFDKFKAFARGEGVEFWDQVTKRLVESYGAWLDAEGYAYRSEFLELMTIKQIMKWLIEDEKVLQPSCRLHLPIPQPPKETTTYCYTDAEVSAIIEKCYGSPDLHWLGDVVVALTYTGLRIGELAQLRWADVDLVNGKIRIIDNSRSGRKQVAEGMRTTKTHKSRSVPLYAEVKRVLETMTRQKDDRVFHGPWGGLLKPDTIRNVLIREVIKPLAGKFPGEPGHECFSDGRLHSFRHYFCSKCSRDGVPQETVQAWLGHQSSLMTKHYYHLHDQESQRVMNQIRSVGGRPASFDENQTDKNERHSE